MSDPDLPPIETRSGDRPSTTLAERAAVGLAVLALGGGILVAVGNWLGNEDGPTASGSPVALTTPGPSPSTPPRTPAPTPTPWEVVLIAGEPSASVVPEQPWVFNGWIRALAEQPIRFAANALQGEVGILRAGDIGYAEDVAVAGWLRVSVGGDIGYIEELDGRTALIERIAPEPHLVSGDIWELVAGAGGFVARGYAPAMDDRPSPQLTAFSPDGATWQAIDDLPAFAYSVFAWGPAGWLAVGVQDEPAGPTMWVFRSADGIHWSSLGGTTADSPLNNPSRLVGSTSGYLLETWSSRGDALLWYSSDGVSWVGSVDPLVSGITGGDHRLSGIGSGFYLWTFESELSTIGRQAYSPDGRSWRAVEDGPEGVNMKLATIGDRVIAAITDPDSGSVRFTTGGLASSTLTWETDAVGKAYPGVAVSALISDGVRAVAILRDRVTDEPMVWSSTDATQWTPSRIPAGAFGGITRVAAGGPAGIVLVGYRPTVRGPNPIIWREVGAGWAAEPAPLIPLVPDPPAGTCEPPPEDFLSFMVVDLSRVVNCFGSMPLTFRAWSTLCQDCYYEDPGVYDPAWLANPTTNQLFLSPIASDSWGSQTAVAHPTVVIDPAWTGRWLELTGHFGDPAATTCRFHPPPDRDEYFDGLFRIVESCRQRFVVTAVRVVEGP